MFFESPPILARSEDILGKPFSGFDPRLQKHYDILLTYYQKNSIIKVTKAKTKNVFTISKYISLILYFTFVMYVYTLKVYK